MTRILTPFLVFIGLAFGASPASAYCLYNKTSIPLSAQLESYSPLGDFRKVIQPGRKACCDWFDRRCNPSGTRGAMVSLSIKNVKRNIDRPDVDTLSGRKRYVPIPTFNRYGQPDPNGLYDAFGVYDEHGHKPYFERIKTFDRNGNPDPRGHYDQSGTYDKFRHSGRRGRLVIPKKRPETEPLEVPKDAKEYFCVRGRQPLVMASAGGTVSITEDSLKTGGLRCESRDQFLRPINPPSQAEEFGVPMSRSPLRKPRPTMRRGQTIQTN